MPRKPRTASPPKPQDGESRPHPNAAGGGTGLPPVSGRTLSVRSRRTQFRRAGILFTPSPTIVRESEIGPDRLNRILAEPILVCEQV